MRTSTRRYVRRFVPAILGYVVLLGVAVLLVGRYPTAPWRFAVVLLPVIPLGLVVWAVVRYLRDADELQRRIQLEALAFAFGIGAVITFAVGLLQSVGLPVISWLFVWPVLAGLWLIGLALARRRY